MYNGGQKAMYNGTEVEHALQARRKMDLPKGSPEVQAEGRSTVHCYFLQALEKMRLYVAKPPATILQQVNHCTSMEACKKRVQFATLFHLLN